MNIYLKIFALTFVFAAQCSARVHSINEFGDYYGYRCDAYNSQETTVRMKPTEVSKSKEEALSDCTDSMNEFLLKVNQKRRATMDERKLALQSIMGTAIVHGETTHYARNNHPTDSPLFRHFEALRYAELLCNRYILQIRTGKDEESHLIDDYRIKLENYSKVEADVFDDWLSETLQQHGLGFMPTFQSSLPSNHKPEDLKAYIKNNKLDFLVAIAISYLKNTKVVDERSKFIPKRKLQYFAKAIKVYVDKELEQINAELEKGYMAAHSLDADEEEAILEKEAPLMETERKAGLLELKKQLDIENEVIKHINELQSNSTFERGTMETITQSKISHQERARRLKKLIEIKKSNQLEKRKADLEKQKEKLDLKATSNVKLRSSGARVTFTARAI